MILLIKTKIPNRLGSYQSVRFILFWWRRGESNSCPKERPISFLRAQFVFGFALQRSTNRRLKAISSSFPPFSPEEQEKEVPSQSDARHQAVRKPERTSSIKQLLIQTYRLQLLLFLAFFTMLATTRLAYLSIFSPVETSTPPFLLTRCHNTSRIPYHA